MPLRLSVARRRSILGLAVFISSVCYNSLTVAHKNYEKIYEGIIIAENYLRRRLRRINEESSVQQMPRRRSNSLPIPKIEVSIYQSPESKKKDVSKDFIEIPEVRDVSLLAGI